MPLKKPLNNFGDLLGPLIAKNVLKEVGYKDKLRVERELKVYTIGSVLHFAKDDDVIWGCGKNGKISEASHRFNTLDVRAVRGPLTRQFLLDRGIDCPEVYGDPALLIQRYFPQLQTLPKRREVGFIAHYNDKKLYRTKLPEISPCEQLEKVLRFIAESEFIVSTSLHGVVIAEALGIESRFVKSSAEDSFKYRDYLLGTGEREYSPADSPEEGVKLGGQGPVDFDAEQLIKAFPLDLFQRQQALADLE